MISLGPLLNTNQTGNWDRLPLLLVCMSLPGLVAAGPTLLLQEDFDNALRAAPVGWILEGSGIASVKNGALHLRETPEGVGAVIWTKRDWPADLRFSFEVRFSNNRGIGVFFIAAKASNGGDALKDAPGRTGAYDEYIRGDLDSYSLSLHRYWPDGRNNPGSNLRRNSGFHLLNQAMPDPCLEAGKTYRIEITKIGGHLTVKVDGEIVHEAVDDGSHGPVHGAGKIGFRVRGDPSCIMTIDTIRIRKLEPMVAEETWSDGE